MKKPYDQWISTGWIIKVPMHRILVKIGLVLCCTLVIFAANAQKYGDRINNMEPFYTRTCRSQFVFDKLPENNSPVWKQAHNYLLNKLTNLHPETTDLSLVADKESPGGYHETFEQLFAGVPVFMSQVKVNLAKNLTVLSIFDNSYNTAGWQYNYLSSLATDIEKSDIIERYRAKMGLGEVEIIGRVVIAPIDPQNPIVVQELTIYDAVSGAYYRVLADKDLKVWYQQDLNSYALGDTTAIAFVFNPDPLTTAQVAYVPPYVDSSDADIPELNAERQQVTIHVTLSLGLNYELKSDYFELKEFSSPVTSAPVNLTGVFNYTRAEDNFEDVNAYYHLQTENNYIRSLGYADLSDILVQYDAHALGIDNDNSMFSAGSGIPRLFFGTGGVDDAEDADVVVHEYGHALSDQASPNSNSGVERLSLDEGFGDYLATSYSKNISTFRWDDMFTWDGHNEYWSGRTASSTMKYPGNLSNSIHSNGQMWSSALMEIWDIVGRDTADILALETLYAFASNMSFSDAALAYMQADDVLYGGIHHDDICAVFVARGFLNQDCTAVSVKETPDALIGIQNTLGAFANGEPLIISASSPLQKVEVYSITGQLIGRSEINNELRYSYDVSYIRNSGVYIVKVTAVNGSTYATKIVK